MANNSNVKANLDGLNGILKGLKTNHVLRVGILGADAKAQHDNESGLTNAELGSVHEFGTHINHPGGTPYKILANGMAQFVSKKDGAGLPVTKAHAINIPARSFLEKPLKERLNFNNPDMKDFKKEIFKDYFVKNTPEQFLHDLGVKALDIINEAFESGGFGEWKELTAGTKRQKAKRGDSPDKLIGQGRGGLRTSISFDVKRKFF